MKTANKDYCPNCKQITNHNILYSVEDKSDSGSDFHWIRTYGIVQCMGCENIQFRNEYWDESLIRYGVEGEEEQYSEYKYYPQNIKYHSPLEYIYELPDKIRVVYLETLDALKSACYLLAGVGLRAIIEAVCMDRNISGRNLEVKINKLAQNKLITEKDKNRLHSIRFLENDSVHEMNVPEEEKLNVALRIIENLLQNQYLIDKIINKHLDTIIDKYEDFKHLVLNIFISAGFNTGDEKNIKEILKRDYRRIDPNQISIFENQLTNDIQSSSITLISIGKRENNQQYYIKN